MTAGINAALVAVHAELQNPKKNQTAKAGSFSYSYADLATILDQVRPILARHGLAVAQDIRMEDGLQVFTLLLHDSGEQLTFGPIRGGTGSDWQAMGSAISYARRYGLISALGLMGEGEDDDGAATKVTRVKVSHSDQTIPDDPWAVTAVEAVQEVMGGTVIVPGGLSGPAARAVVRNGSEPATEKQLFMVRKLVAQAATTAGLDSLELMNAQLQDLKLATVTESGELTKGQASALIDVLMKGAGK